MYYNQFIIIAKARIERRIFMKVIKEGKEIKGTMRVTCKTCGAELEIQAGDLKRLPEVPFYPTTYSYKCPCCLRTNYLGYSDLTEEIRFELNN